MQRRVVVPLDGSGFAEAALRPASRIAQQTGAHLDLVTVHQAPLTGADPMAAMDLNTRIRQQEIRYLGQTAEREAATWRLAVASCVVEGPVVPKLAQHVRERGAGLVVMSTHGRSGVSRVFLGSTADRLIRELHCPILLVNPSHQADPLGSGLAPRVLVALDGSTLAESILEQVAAVFPAATELELVRVVVPPLAVVPPIAVGLAPLPPDTLEKALAEADESLEAVAARLVKQGFAVRLAVVTDFSPAAAIANRARERRCDVIAIATRGLGGLERAFLGSVADKVIRAADVPVLVWNPPAGSPAGAVHAEEAGAGAAAT